MFARKKIEEETRVKVVSKKKQHTRKETEEVEGEMTHNRHIMD